jgi:hypothetical protein
MEVQTLIRCFIYQHGQQINYAYIAMKGGLEGIWKEAIVACWIYCPAGNEKCHVIITIAGVSTWIRTQYLPNIRFRMLSLG